MLFPLTLSNFRMDKLSNYKRPNENKIDMSLKKHGNIIIKKGIQKKT